MNNENKFVSLTDPSASKIIPVFLIENYMTYSSNSNKGTINRYYNMIIENLKIINCPPFLVSSLLKLLDLVLIIIIFYVLDTIRIL